MGRYANFSCCQDVLRRLDKTFQAFSARVRRARTRSPALLAAEKDTRRKAQRKLQAQGVPPANAHPANGAEHSSQKTNSFWASSPEIFESLESLAYSLSESGIVGKRLKVPDRLPHDRRAKNRDTDGPYPYEISWFFQLGDFGSYLWASLAAIAQTGGRILIFGGGVGDGNLFQGNGEGIDIFQAGSARFFGRNVIRSNGDVGIQIWGSSALFDGGGTLPDGSLSATIVQNHNTVGINVVRSGELTMLGPHQIQNNGSLGADPTRRGGIRLNRGSLTLRGVQISNNTGPGIRADQNTGTSITDVTVSGNTEEGVLVDKQSVAGFSQPLFIVGNGTASISCDTTSLIFGDLTGGTGMNCMRIERQVGPPRPGRVLP